MPALLTLPQSGDLSITDLNNGERATALYASDMPSSFRFRKGDGEKLCAWILQGVARLGLEELHRVTAYTGGYLELWVEEQNTPGQDAAHFARFPDQKRFHVAQHEAAMVTFLYGTSDAAIERSRRRMVETSPVGVAVAA
ncbi:hypothetical protein [Streptomyces sp. Qhu_M48]|uniref:hypothetical protein n=1 Tax=Streptomyces sp. Qhu_M48 TaxID=3435889 RepID=UPI003F4F9317